MRRTPVGRGKSWESTRNSLGNAGSALDLDPGSVGLEVPLGHWGLLPTRGTQRGQWGPPGDGGCPWPGWWVSGGHGHGGQWGWPLVAGGGPQGLGLVSLLAIRRKGLRGVDPGMGSMDIPEGRDGICGHGQAGEVGQGEPQLKSCHWGQVGWRRRTWVSRSSMGSRMSRSGPPTQVGHGAIGASPSLAGSSLDWAWSNLV